LSALVQGGLIRRLVPQFGEAWLIVAGLLLVAAGFAGLAMVADVPALAGSLILLGLGQGLVSPSLSGLLSRITPPSEQGAVFGTLSSVQTLARMISYSAANILLGRVSTAAPFWAAAGVDILALAVAGRIAVRLGRDRLMVA
jgi:DHA1 family tetracycline resistance protein-like MFS transporter